MLSYPTLIQQASSIICNSRPASYFKEWKDFTDSWSPILGIPEEIIQISGANLAGATDDLFDETLSEQALSQLYEEMNALTYLQPAQDYLNSLVTDDALSLEEAIKVHIAFLTTEGYRLQVQAGKDILAKQWLTGWQTVMDAYNTQQVDTVRTLLRAKEPPKTSASFAEGVALYLNRFSKTDAVSLSIIGGFPFSPLASTELLEELLELAPSISYLYRLVEDIEYDSTERINAGVFATLIEAGISMDEAYRNILSGNPLSSDVQQRLQIIGRTSAKDFQCQLDRLLNNHSPDDTYNILLHVGKKLHSIAIAVIS